MGITNRTYEDLKVNGRKATDAEYILYFCENVDKFKQTNSLRPYIQAIKKEVDTLSTHEQKCDFVKGYLKQALVQDLR